MTLLILRLGIWLLPCGNHSLPNQTSSNRPGVCCMWGVLGRGQRRVQWRVTCLSTLGGTRLWSPGTVRSGDGRRASRAIGRGRVARRRTSPPTRVRIPFHSHSRFIPTRFIVRSAFCYYPICCEFPRFVAVFELLGKIICSTFARLHPPSFPFPPPCIRVFPDLLDCCFRVLITLVAWFLRPGTRAFGQQTSCSKRHLELLRDPGVRASAIPRHRLSRRPLLCLAQWGCTWGFLWQQAVWQRHYSYTVCLCFQNRLMLWIKNCSNS